MSRLLFCSVIFSIAALLGSWANGSSQPQTKAQFTAPQPWEIKRLFQIYKLQKPRKYLLLMKLKERNFPKFFSITQNLIYQQRLKDYQRQIARINPYRRRIVHNKKTLQALARKYYQAPTPYHRRLTERQLDEIIREQVQLQTRYKGSRIQHLKNKISKIEKKWEKEDQSHAALILKRKLLWKASNALY